MEIVGVGPGKAHGSMDAERNDRTKNVERKESTYKQLLMFGRAVGGVHLCSSNRALF